MDADSNHALGKRVRTIACTEMMNLCSVDVITKTNVGAYIKNIIIKLNFVLQL